MKNTYMMLAFFVGLLISACGSDQQTNRDNDSLMTDSVAMDSANIPKDTAAPYIDKLNSDSTTTNPPR